MFGGGGGEAADHGAERQDLARPAVEQGRQVQLVEQAGGVSGAVVVVPAGRCAGDVGDHAAGQVKVDVVLAVADVGGAVEDIGLIFGHPERLGDHPFRRDRASAGVVYLQGGIVEGRDAGGLGGGAHVHPDDRRAERAAGGVHRHHRAAGGIGGEADDLVVA